MSSTTPSPRPTVDPADADRATLALLAESLLPLTSSQTTTLRTLLAEVSR